MKRLVLLIGLLAAACSSEPLPEPTTPPSATLYRPVNGGGLAACQKQGFDIICRPG